MIIKNKDEGYEIFDLYEDDISTLYSVFIAPRTQIIIDGIKRGFSLSKTFKMNRTLSKDMYQNKLNYSTLKFEDNFDAYILMYFDYETVNIMNLKKNELGRVSTGFVQDRAFIAILLQNEEFPVEYENNNCDLNLVYTKTQDEFFLFTLRKLYELQLFSDFIRIATGKEKETEDIIRWDFCQNYITINASEKTKHYYLKINGTDEYDQQTMFRQHFGMLANWKLNNILKMLKLNPKDDLEIKKIDCIAPKEAIEYINKITKYRLILDLTIIPLYEYSYSNKTKMINNLFVNLAHQEKFEISFKYRNRNQKEKFKDGLVGDPEKGFSSLTHIVLDFNSLYPSLMTQNNICFLTKLLDNEERKKCYEISFEDIKEKTKYVRFSKTKYVRFSKTKKELIPTILKLLIKQRKQAKKDRSKYNKSDKIYVNELTESHINQGNSENLIYTKALAFIEKNYNYYNILQNVLKRIANSIYGQFDKKVNEEDFSKIIYDIQKKIVLVSYNKGINLQNEINKWIANEIESSYIVIEKKKGLKNHVKEVLKVDNITKEMIDEYIKTANEYTLLSYSRKFDNLLAKETDLEYQNFINFNENEWCRDISKKIIKDFIKYLYSKETELELELFEQNARNNEEEDNDQDYIYLQKDELKEDGSVIEYKKVELKQVSDEDTTSYVKKFVADMKLISIK
ncbi:22099_t:CDS:2, partial [Cetraspora pellucida]